MVLNSTARTVVNSVLHNAHEEVRGRGERERDRKERRLKSAQMLVKTMVLLEAPNNHPANGKNSL